MSLGSNRLLSDEDFTALQEKFQLIDNANDGKITVSNLARFYHAVGLTETVDEATASKVLESIKCKSLNYRQFIVHHEKLLEKVPEDKIKKMLAQRRKAMGSSSGLSSSSTTSIPTTNAKSNRSAGISRSKSNEPKDISGDAQSNEYSKRLSDLRAAIEQAEAKLAQLNSECQSVQQVLEESKKKHEDVSQECAKLEKTIAQYKQEYEQLEATHASRQAEVDKELEAQRAEKKKYIDELSKEAEALEELIRQRKEILAQLDKQIEEKKSQLAHLAEKASSGEVVSDDSACKEKEVKEGKDVTDTPSKSTKKKRRRSDKGTKTKKEKKDKAKDHADGSKDQSDPASSEKEQSTSVNKEESQPAPQEDEKLEELDKDIFTVLVNKLDTLLHELHPFSGRLDPLYYQILSNEKSLLMPIVMKQIKVPPDDKSKLEALSQEVGLKVESALRIVKDYHAILVSSTQLKSQVFHAICEIHCTLHKMLRHLETCVKLMHGNIPGVKISEPQAQQLLAQYLSQDGVMIKMDQLKSALQSAIDAERLRSLEYILDPWSTQYVCYARIAMFEKEFGGLISGAHRLKELLSHPAFQGYMSDTEASSILSSLGTGSWMFVLHKTQLTPYLLWATSDGIERGRIIFNSDSTYTLEKSADATSTIKYATLDQLIASCSSFLTGPAFKCRFAVKSWYHGEISADEAQRLLIPGGDGTFLFRLSSKKGHIAISYVFREKVGHTLIKYNHEDQYENGTNTFKGLEALIAMHAQIFRYALDNRTFVRSDNSTPSLLF